MVLAHTIHATITKGEPATEYVLLPIVQISQILIPNRSQVLSCELLVSLQDAFCRFAQDRPNLSLFGLACAGFQRY